MRAPAGDRAGPAVAALCLAVVICTAGAGGVNASFRVSPGGAAYSAAIEVEGAGSHTFWEYGPLGERIPRPVSNVTLHGACGNCSFDWIDPYTMNFTPGNYTILYSSGIQGNQLQGTFEGPYHVFVQLPQGLDVRNPLLGFLSPGAEIIGERPSPTIVWNRTRAFELRFYDPGRERILITFGAFWAVGLVLVLLPYLFSRKGGKEA